jgi:Glycoside-hydrolase family GH114
MMLAALRHAIAPALLALLVGGASAPTLSTTSAVAAEPPEPLPVGVDWDYQLGGPAPVPEHVQVVVRDRRATPEPGAYNICYVNAFQTQPDEKRFWRDGRRWRLVLKKAGRPVVDGAWGEWLLDIRRPARRAALAVVVGRWIDRCAADGFDAVELDNLDSFGRSEGLLTGADAQAYARLLVDRAHTAGLGVAQKNWAELGERGTRLGFDFAIAEECARYDECTEYQEVYGERVLVVEYRDVDFAAACEHHPDLPVLRADRALTPTSARDWC